jgi:hypothetical protein
MPFNSALGRREEQEEHEPHGPIHDMMMKMMIMTMTSEKPLRNHWAAVTQFGRPELQ